MSSATKERGVLFNGAMVRAILDGQKTCTRRPVKPQPPDGITEVHRWGALDPVAFDPDLWGFWGCEGLDMGQPHNCLDHEARNPLGAPGDLIYCRETWRKGTALYTGGKVAVASYKAAATEGGCRPDPEVLDAVWESNWRPSIHMPKWAARVWLRVTDVRVERVQEIDEAGAIAEGIQRSRVPMWCGAPHRVHGMPTQHNTAPEAFATIWNSIYAAKGLGWDANPWVFVTEFERVERPEGGAS